MPNPDAFTIHHYDSVLTIGARVAGANLLANPGAESGDLTGWTASSPGFSAEAEANIGPTPMSGSYAFLAGAAAGSRSRTLTSDRVAVTAGTKYYFGFLFGSLYSSAGRQNNLKAVVRWYDAPAGGNLLSTRKVWGRPVPATGLWHSVFRAKTAPAGATHAAVHFKNARHGSLTALDVKTTTAIDDVFFGAETTTTRPTLIETLRHHSVAAGPLSFTNLAWTNNARAGFKDLTFTVYGPPEDLTRWCDALLHHVEAYFGPSRRFEGYVQTVDGMVDGRPVRFSMDSIYNDCIVDGARGIRRRAQAYDSIQRYGRKQWYESDEKLFNETVVQQRSLYLRNRHRQPVNLRPFENGGENNSLNVTVSGYWSTLEFLDLITIWYGYGADTSVIMATGDGASDNLSILNTVRLLFGNEFISNDYSNVDTTGTIVRFSGGSTKLEQQGKPLGLIEDLLNMGDDSRNFLVSGVWLDRMFKLQARPSTVGYWRRNENGQERWYDASGGEVERAMVDAGQFVKTPRLVPTWTSYSDAYNDPDAAFLWEVQYDAESDTLAPIPPDADVLERGLAHAFRWVQF